MSQNPYLSARRSAFLVVLAAVVFPLAAPVPAPAAVNEAVRVLAKLLRPAKASDKVEQGDLQKTAQQLVRILEAMEESNRTSGPQADDLLMNAYQLEFRDRMTRNRMIVTAGAIGDAYETAKDLGLFDEAGKFKPLITKGSEQGQNAVFESIVPAAQAPAFSLDLANIRIVSPRDRRPKAGGTGDGAPALSHDELAWLGQIKGFEKEALEGKPDEMGRTKAENLALWQQEVEAAGEEANREPYIKISGGLSASPSKSNDFRWRVTLDIVNNSRHPTDVTVECFLLCSRGDDPTVYVFGQKKHPMKLRSAEAATRETWSPSVGYNPTEGEEKKKKKKGKKNKKPPPPEMRGWVARVMHEGKLVAIDASQRPYIMRYGQEVTSMPKMSMSDKVERKSDGDDDD